VGLFEGFVYGVVGGILSELLGWFRLRQQAPSEFPIWLKSPFYWVLTVLMILAGGALVVIYLRSSIDLKPIVAVNLGASAPLIIGSLVAQAPKSRID
jgi:hypothetical protein